jgi:hypothetical protein
MSIGISAGFHHVQWRDPPKTKERTEKKERKQNDRLASERAEREFLTYGTRQAPAANGSAGTLREEWSFHSQQVV